MSNNLKELREARGMTQEALSKASGVHRVAIAKHETMDIGMTVDTAVRLANALNCTIDDLINKDEKKEA